MVTATGSTTAKTAPASPLASRMAAGMNTVATAPESRLVRTGVPSLGWRAPRALVKNAPCAAAMACMRSLTIIQALPCVSRAKTNMTAVSVRRGPAVPP